MQTNEARIRELEDEVDRLASKVARLQALVDEWGIEGGPPIKIRSEKLEGRMAHLEKGDALNLTYTTATGTNHLLSSGTIQERCNVDHVSIYSFRDALGYSHAYAGMFGKAKMPPLSLSDVAKIDDKVEVAEHG